MIGNIIVMGIQGSGKGTQAKLITEKLPYHHVNIGESFRTHVKSQTELGKKIKSIMESGALVPDTYVFEILDLAVKGVENYILDGFPRTIAQAEYLIEHYPISAVIYFELEDIIAKKRMMARRFCTQCGADYNTISAPTKVAGVCNKCQGPVISRADDTPEAIDARIQLFHNETKPLLEFFETKVKVHRINADAPVEDINKRLIDFIK